MLQSYARPLVRFLKAEDGPTAVEYAVMLALIIVVCITSVTTLGTEVQGDVHDGGSIRCRPEVDGTVCAATRAASTRLLASAMPLPAMS